jgi:hypothetical protein
MKKFIKSPLSWAAMLFGMLFLATLFQKEKVSQQPSHRVWSLDDSQDSLLRPYVTPGKVYGVFLDGGQAPIFANEVPRLYFGKLSEKPLHLAILADWESSAGRELLRRIQTTYDADAEGSLPSLALIVLPGATEPLEQSIDDIVIATHYVANQIATLPLLMSEISHSPITPQVDHLRDFLNKTEPDILSRVEVFLKVQRLHIEKVWQKARAQQSRSGAVLACHESAQLISMRQVLTGSPTDKDIVAFLHRAKARQDAYLSSPKGLIPVIPPAGCDCKDLTHPHAVRSP